ncbi:MAG: hypothetical protein KJ645_09535, partial [Planctomycetes bacterium]|nr:hypothetical protein [Planctomycetota bacterium]
EMVYEGTSSRQAKIDRNGAITRFAYDKNGNLLSFISPAERKTVYQYDQQSRSISMTDEEGRTTRFEYDSLRNMVKQTNPDIFPDRQYPYIWTGEHFYGTLKEGNCTKWLIKGMVKGPVDVGKGRKIRALIRMHIEFPYPYKSVSRHIMIHHEKSKKLWGPFSQEIFERYLERYKGRVMKFTKTWSP